MELWRPTGVSPRHEVSSEGRVRTTDTHRYMEEGKDSTLELSTGIKTGAGRSKRVHITRQKLLDKVWRFEWIKNLHDEEVKPIKQIPRGYITSRGRVYIEGRGFVAHTYHHYPCVVYKRQDYLIHRLLGEYFISNDNNYPFVLHWDDDRSNYNLSNLRWGDENMNRQDYLRNNNGQRSRQF